MTAPITPDCRYLIVKGRLWRAANPLLDDQERGQLVHELMGARRAVKAAKANQDEEGLAAARRSGQSEEGIGRTGPVWWHDGAEDFNRHLVKNTPYADWFSKVKSSTE